MEQTGEKPVKLDMSEYPIFGAEDNTESRGIVTAVWEWKLAGKPARR